MAGNSNDERQSRKDAKRDARIEAKRRKLAEQRAERAAAAAGRVTAAEETGADTEAAAGQAGAERQITADSANRERRAIIREEDRKAMTPEQSVPEETSGDSPDDISGQGADTAAVSETGIVKAKAGTKAKAKRINAGAVARGIFTRIKKSSANWTPKMIGAWCFVLMVLIFLVWAALEAADYQDKKPEFYITDEGFGHDDRFDGCAALIGIDVSEHQEGEINWERVKSSGADYVFVRAGYRAADNGTLHADDNFKANMKGAEKAGLMVGVYFYSQALTPGEAKEEAEFVLDMVKDYDITMPVAIDYEIYEGGRLDKKIQAGELYAASLYHDIVLGFTNTVEAAGYESAVYANHSMLTNYMQADLLDDMATIWLASYDSVATLDADYWFWQCTEAARVSGIEGSVDQNFWYVRPEKVYETRAKHRKNAVSVRDCRISFRRSVTRLRNFRAMPKFDMTHEGKGMKEGRDYVSSIVRNTKSGTGYVIIRGIGKYKDWIMYPFNIE